MARKRRNLEVFSLSFLDVMSCGFGAIVLLFLIVKHNGIAFVERPQSSSEVELIEQEIQQAQENLVLIRNTVSEIDDQLATAQGLAVRIQNELDQALSDAQSLADTGQDEITRLREELSRLQAQKAELDAERPPSGRNLREFAGRGQREYLSGIRVSGKRILILLDTSASMLDERIVNILRYRNMDDAAKRQTRKWRQAVRTVDWLTARFPPDASYQVYTFGTSAQPVQDGTRGSWLTVTDSEQLEDTVDRVHALVPVGGTSLDAVFSEIAQLKPAPDAIYLITDGLPTQGRTPRQGMISGSDRLRLFWEAVRRVPERIPMHVILLSMEGDPDAAGAFWRLAQLTGGSFVTPTEDWP